MEQSLNNAAATDVQIMPPKGAFARGMVHRSIDAKSTSGKIFSNRRNLQETWSKGEGEGQTITMTMQH